jgi:hypothetical protein
LGNVLDMVRRISPQPTLHESPLNALRQIPTKDRESTPPVCKACRRPRRAIRAVLSGCRRPDSFGNEKHGVVLTLVDICARASAYTETHGRLDRERKSRQGFSEAQDKRAAEKANGAPRRASIRAYSRTTDRQRGRGKTTSYVDPRTNWLIPLRRGDSGPATKAAESCGPRPMHQPPPGLEEEREPKRHRSTFSHSRSIGHPRSNQESLTRCDDLLRSPRGGPIRLRPRRIAQMVERR